MKINFIFLIFLGFLGCSQLKETSLFENPEINLLFDHKAISNKDFISSNISEFLSTNNDKSSEVTFYHETWVYALDKRNTTSNTISVRIREHQPLARWKDKGFLTHSGHLIYPKQSELDFNLITLRGPEESKFILLDYSRELEKQLNRFNQDLVEFRLHRGGHIDAITSTGMNLLFYKENFRDQLERLENLITFELVSGKLNNIKSIDLRYKNGISVLFI